MNAWLLLVGWLAGGQWTVAPIMSFSDEASCKRVLASGYYYIPPGARPRQVDEVHAWCETKDKA